MQTFSEFRATGRYADLRAEECAADTFSYLDCTRPVNGRVYMSDGLGEVYVECDAQAALPWTVTIANTSESLRSLLAAEALLYALTQETRPCA